MYSWNFTDVYYSSNGFLYVNDGYYYACYNDYSYYMDNATWYWQVWNWNCQFSSPPVYSSSYYFDTLSYYYLTEADYWYSWNYVDVIYADDGFLYYANDYYYACYNGYSYYFEDGYWYWNWSQWSCRYESEPAYDYSEYYFMGYYMFFDMYSWNYSTAYANGGFLYYANDYYYMCYNDYQYYFANGTWYWNMWQWNCKYDSKDDAEYAAYYYDGFYYSEKVIGTTDDYDWSDDIDYGYVTYTNGYMYYCYDGYSYWYNASDYTWEWDMSSIFSNPC